MKSPSFALTCLLRLTLITSDARTFVIVKKNFIVSIIIVTMDVTITIDVITMA